MEIRKILRRAGKLIAGKDREGIRSLFQRVEPADAAEVFRSFPLAQRLFLLSALPIEYAADIFEELDDDEQEDLVSRMEEHRLAKLLDELDPDERADLLANFPEDILAHFLSLMDKEEAEDARRLISYPPDTAGGRMTTDYASVSPEMTVAEAIAELRKEARDVETIYFVYVVDDYGKLRGVTSLKDLVLARPDEKVGEMMHTDLVAVPVDIDQEKVARDYFARYDYFVLPVIGRTGEMMGIITADDILDILQEENTEDMHRFGAAGVEDNYMSSPVFTVARRRFTWLFLLVIASFFSVMLMDTYAGVLGSIITLAFFIPLLMNSAGNAGTQAATVAVRGLATGELRIRDFWKVLKKELLVGVTLGVALGILGMVRAFLLNKSPALGVTVGSTMVAAVIVSTTIGGVLPFIFKKLGFDPALMSGPLLTTIVDISTLAIYFELARFIFGVL